MLKLSVNTISDYGTRTLGIFLDCSGLRVSFQESRFVENVLYILRIRCVTWREGVVWVVGFALGGKFKDVLYRTYRYLLNSNHRTCKGDGWMHVERGSYSFGEESKESLYMERLV